MASPFDSPISRTDYDPAILQEMRSIADSVLEDAQTYSDYNRATLASQAEAILRSAQQRARGQAREIAGRVDGIINGAGELSRRNGWSLGSQFDTYLTEAEIRRNLSGIPSAPTLPYPQPPHRPIPGGPAPVLPAPEPVNPPIGPGSPGLPPSDLKCPPPIVACPAPIVQCGPWQLPTVQVQNVINVIVSTAITTIVNNQNFISVVVQPIINNIVSTIVQNLVNNTINVSVETEKLGRVLCDCFLAAMKEMRGDEPIAELGDVWSTKFLKAGKEWVDKATKYPGQEFRNAWDQPSLPMADFYITNNSSHIFELED